MKEYSLRVNLFIAFAIMATIWRPCLIFFIPGVAILFLPVFRKIDLIELLIYIIGISVCFWISSFWFLLYFPLSLTSFFITITAISFLIVSYFLIKRKIAYAITVNFSHFALILIFMFIFYLRIIPLLLSYVPAGADMSVHTYIAKLIQQANGVPTDYHPIIGLDKFNSYPVGFSTLSALIAWLGDIPCYRGAYIMTSLTYAFLTLFLFVLLKKYVGWNVALISSIAFTFLTINPQFTIYWGGNPSPLALALCTLYISLLFINDKNIWTIAISSLCLVSILLTHTQIFLLMIYCVGIPYGIYITIAQRPNFSFSELFLGLLIFLIIILPYLINVERGLISPEVISRVKEDCLTSFHAWNGNFYNFLWTIPLYIKMYLFGGGKYISYLLYGGGVTNFILAISALGIFLLFKKDVKICLLYLGCFFSGILLILNTRHWVLPFSYAILPERVPYLMIVPLAVFFAYGIEGLLRTKIWKESHNFQLVISSILIIGSLVLAYQFNKKYYVNQALAATSVTHADLQAMMWLDEHAKENSVIKNNYGDAGLWIPAVIFRPITDPQVHSIYLDKVKEIGKPSYVYIGKKCVYNCPLKAKKFMQSDRHKLIYSKDGVYIFEININ